MANPARDYDLFVIGGGSGGVRAARIAAGHGARVGLAEADRMGGTCVIRGCVPKKLLVYAARFADAFADAAGFGWRLGERSFDWPTLIAAKDREIARLEGLYTAGLERAGVTVHHDRATLEGPHGVRLERAQQSVTAERILIATGGAPILDATLPGIEHVITSDDIFDLPRLPERIVVIGGGYIGLEFASLLRGLGAQVTVIYRGEEILRGFDDDLRHHLHEALVARGVDVRVRSRLTSVARGSDGLECLLHDGTSIPADQVLCAIGRRANVRGLGLEAVGVELDDQGRPRVDRWSQTSQPSIYAVGDVTDGLALTPVAIQQGHALADTLYGGRPTPVDHDCVATAVFTTPELATVGLTEAEARQRHPNVAIYSSRFRPLKAILAGREERALVKLVVNADDDRLLGVHLAGPEVSEIIQLAAVTLRLGATKADFDRTIAVHPTLAEELVTLRS
jgi:NADPH-glutathione reductase (EC 1.8.1.7)